VAYTHPGTIPDRSDSTLVTSYAYNPAGWVQDVTDPRGIVTRTVYDALHRRTSTIEAYTGGVPNGSSDRTTAYTYDGSNHVLTLKAFLDASQFELTQYVYGVSTAAGSNINSNDLLASTIYPDNG